MTRKDVCNWGGTSRDMIARKTKCSDLQPAHARHSLKDWVSRRIKRSLERQGFLICNLRAPSPASCSTNQLTIDAPNPVLERSQIQQRLALGVAQVRQIQQCFLCQSQIQQRFAKPSTEGSQIKQRFDSAQRLNHSDTISPKSTSLQSHDIHETTNPSILKPKIRKISQSINQQTANPKTQQPKPKT